MNAETKERKFRCDICGQTLATKANLNVHQRIHTGEKNYKCEVCDAAFLQSSHLKVHLRAHAGEKSHNCQVCGAAFLQKSHLIEHTRIHTGEKNFQCHQCDKAFSRSRDLKTHLRIHSGEKNYRCKECGAAFSQSTTLTAHLRIHTGEKNYRCRECGAQFVQGGALRTHLKIHTDTGAKQYRCPYCVAAFSDSSHLSRHIAIHNSDKNSCQVNVQRSTDQMDSFTETAINPSGEEFYESNSSLEKRDYKTVARYTDCLVEADESSGQLDTGQSSNMTIEGVRSTDAKVQNVQTTAGNFENQLQSDASVGRNCIVTIQEEVDSDIKTGECLIVLTVLIILQTILVVRSHIKLLKFNNQSTVRTENF